jgi:S1-C subfamily serine protease
MKHLLLLPLLALASCDKPAAVAASAPAAPAPASSEPSLSVVRVNATRQSWNITQPWEKSAPGSLRALGTLVRENQIITTAEMVADATFIELESTDGTRRARAEVANVDYEANLALLRLPASEDAAAFFKDMKPLEIAANPPLRDALEIIQVEENGQSLVTSGTLLTADMRSSFLPGQLFLTFIVKASMQSSASSFTLPVFNDGKLAGILSSYDSKDQICEVIATPLIARFLTESQKPTYQGFPNLGISITDTEDRHLRDYLKLPADEGGMYIIKVRKQSAAETASLLPGDVILSIEGKAIDRRGYYQDSDYGSLHWIQLVRGNKSAGDALQLRYWRDGKAHDASLTLTRQEESTRLIPNYAFGKAPNFLIKGGILFQEMTRPLLEAYGDEWQSSAPLNYLDAYSNPEKYQENHDRMICLTGVIPTQATVGYEGLRNLLVSKVNGKPVRNMKDLVKALKSPPLGSQLHSIEFLDEDLTIYLDQLLCESIDQSLLQRGLSQLSRAE